MPGTRCAVAVCSNSWAKATKQKLLISFHKFPKNKELRNLWIKACRRKDEWNPDTSHICSVHFKEEHFVVDLRSQLMNIKTKRQLISGGTYNNNFNKPAIY
jgi:hypothetical protein